MRGLGSRRRAQAQRREAAPAPLARRHVFDVVVMVAVLALVVLGLRVLRDPQTLPIRQVAFVDETVHVEPMDLRETVASNLSGGFLDVDLGRIERALEALPWVVRASVRRRWPDGLLISVTEQEPLARWGQDGLLNVHGGVFRPDNVDDFRHLPVLFGPKGQSLEVARRFQRIEHLLEPTGLSLRALVEDERRAWHMMLGNGIPVELGRGDSAAMLRRFVRIYPRILAPRVARIAGVDLRYTNGLAVSWKLGKDSEGNSERSS
jgi:cell division protein FtsQ